MHVNYENENNKNILVKNMFTHSCYKSLSHTTIPDRVERKGERDRARENTNGRSVSVK